MGAIKGSIDDEMVGCTSAGWGGSQHVINLPVRSAHGFIQHGPLLSDLIVASTLEIKRTLSWCSLKKKNPHKPLTDKSKKKRKKTGDWARSSDLSQKIDALVGFAGERTGNMASCDPEHVQADKWWLISGVFACVLEGSSLQHQAAAAHRSRLWGEAAAVRLCSLARIRFSAALSNNNAEMITPFSPLKYPRDYPEFKRKGVKKKNVRAQRCAAVRGAQRSGWGGDKRVEMVAVRPDQLNSPRTGEGWGGVLFLHRLMGGKRRCHFS